jgi:hypothetical protein
MAGISLVMLLLLAASTRQCSAAERAAQGTRAPRALLADTGVTAAYEATHGAASRDTPAGRAGRAARARARCDRLLKAHWCQAFYAQPPQAFKPPPAYGRACPGEPACSGMGVCNAMTGLCDCPAGAQSCSWGCEGVLLAQTNACAKRPHSGGPPISSESWAFGTQFYRNHTLPGWGGSDCAAPDKRPCTNRYNEAERAGQGRASHIGPDKRDADWMVPGWTASRCAGGAPRRIRVQNLVTASLAAARSRSTYVTTSGS